MGTIRRTGAAAQASQTINGTALIGAAAGAGAAFQCSHRRLRPDEFHRAITGPGFVDVSKFKLEAALNADHVRGARWIAAGQAGSWRIRSWIPGAIVTFITTNARLLPEGRALPPRMSGRRQATCSIPPVPMARKPRRMRTVVFTPGTTQTTGTNADDLYADKLP
jgi:hypothetical protein